MGHSGFTTSVGVRFLVDHFQDTRRRLGLSFSPNSSETIEESKPGRGRRRAVGQRLLSFSAVLFSLSRLLPILSIRMRTQLPGYAVFGRKLAHLLTPLLGHGSTVRALLLVVSHFLTLRPEIGESVEQNSAALKAVEAKLRSADHTPISTCMISGGTPSRTGTKLVPSPPETIMCRPLSTTCP